MIGLISKYLSKSGLQIICTLLPASLSKILAAKSLCVSSKAYSSAFKADLDADFCRKRTALNPCCVFRHNLACKQLTRQGYGISTRQSIAKKEITVIDFRTQHP